MKMVTMKKAGYGNEPECHIQVELRDVPRFEANGWTVHIPWEPPVRDADTAAAWPDDEPVALDE